MTNLDLLEYIGEIDDRYILESRRRPKAKKVQWPMILAACAMFAIMVGVGAIALREHWLANTMGQEQVGVDGPASAGSEVSPEQTQDGKDLPVSAYGATLLAGAEYPEAIGYEDYEAQSDRWVENQVSEDTHYALKAFAYSTAAKVFAERTDSECYSPLSLYQALAMLAGGAEGQSQAELLSLLGQPDLETLQDQTGKLYRVNHSDNEVDILQIASSLWLDETAADGSPVSYKEDWVLSTAANYYADVYQVEFSDPETVGALGSWIAERTGGFLQPTAAELALPEDTVMALVNTLWYKVHFQEEFDPADTETGDFTRSDGTVVSAEFMHQTDDMGSYARGEGYTKAYLGLSRGSMTVVLPDEGTSVDALLTEERLWDVFESGEEKSAEVRWSVPKFETNAVYDLESSLKSLGVSDAFDWAAADFSRISDTPLVLAKVQQGTHIAVNEEGVEAAAYTLMGMEAMGLPEEDPEVIEMTLNRPFIYLIKSNNGSPLFIGVVRDPSK